MSENLLSPVNRKRSYKRNCYINSISGKVLWTFRLYILLSYRFDTIKNKKKFKALFIGTLKLWSIGKTNNEVKTQNKFEICRNRTVETMETTLTSRFEDVLRKHFKLFRNNIVILPSSWNRKLIHVNYKHIKDYYFRLFVKIYIVIKREVPLIIDLSDGVQGHFWQYYSQFYW